MPYCSSVRYKGGGNTSLAPLHSTIIQPSTCTRIVYILSPQYVQHARCSQRAEPGAGNNVLRPSTDEGGGRNIPCTPFQVLWPLVGLRNSRNGIWPLVGLRTRNGIWPRVGLRNRTLLIIQSVSSSVSSGGKRKPHRKPHRPGYRGSRVRGQRWLLTEVLDGTSVSSGGVWSSVCGAGRTLAVTCRRCW